VIYESVPELLEWLRLHTPESRSRLVAIEDIKTRTLGFRLGKATFEVHIGVWCEHYGADRVEALAKWRADLRKLRIPVDLDGRREVTDLISAEEKQALPTAWARILGGWPGGLGGVS
jgi:hypothetical protein